MPDKINTLVAIITPILISLGTWLAHSVSRYYARKTYSQNVEILRVRSRAVAADLQRAVDDLKDDSKPGTWGDDVAADVKDRAIRKIAALEPLAYQSILQALDGNSVSANELIGGHVEESVRAIRQSHIASK
jgi:hypothetical protein